MSDRLNSMIGYLKYKSKACVHIGKRQIGKGRELHAWYFTA